MPEPRSPSKPPRLRYVHADRDRHGTVRLYFQRPGGPKTRIRETPGSADFHAHYARLLAADPGRPDAAGGTLGRLVRDYCAAPAFRRLDAGTQRVRRRLLEQCLDEPIAPGDAVTFADFPLRRLTARAVRVLRDRKTDAPETGNARVKAMRQALAWGLEEETPGLAGNPARDVPYIRTGSAGWHSWTLAEVEAYEARHPTGTMARLAIDLLLYTGARRSDVIRLGRPHRRAGWMRWTAHKGRNRAPIVCEIPLLPELARSIDATPCGDMTFLVSEAGRPFGGNYFGNWFARRCAEAGLEGCSAHGLRKAGAVRAAENGASAHQLMAIFGWRTLREAERYTKAASRRALAGEAMHLLARRPDGSNVPTVKPSGKVR